MASKRMTGYRCMVASNLHGCSQRICKAGDKLGRNTQTMRHQAHDGDPQDPATEQECSAFVSAWSSDGSDRGLEETA